MNRYHRPITLAACLLLCTLLGIISAQSQNLDQDAAVSEITSLIDRYASSINSADVELAAKVWAIDDEVSFIHPRGHERGWEQVRSNFYEKTMGQTFSERKLTVRDLVVRVYGDNAWAEFYWDFAAKMKMDGTPLNTKGRETQIFRKTERGWRLVHIHYSGMPVIADRQGF